MIKRNKIILLLAIGSLYLFGCNVQKQISASAAENVTVLDKTFFIPQLNRNRRIRIYLPPEYQISDESYPVLYMHDAQNLFDDATSYAGEWGVDETLNELAKKKALSLIVVGIDNGLDKRMNELSPWTNEQFGQAEGKAYMNFIVQVVKPYIDRHYRTLADKENTAIMGSSMGGLISHYAIFNYRDVFSKAGIFSPSFWYSDRVFEFSDPEKLIKNAKLYFIVGENEGPDMVNGLNKMTNQLLDQGLASDQLSTSVIAGGEHNEALWRSEFSDAVLWLFNKD